LNFYQREEDESALTEKKIEEGKEKIKRGFELLGPPLCFRKEEIAINSSLHARRRLNKGQAQ